MYTLVTDKRKTEQFQKFFNNTINWQYRKTKTNLLSKEIDRLRYLQENWDSYNAEPIFEQSIELAQNFINDLAIYGILIDFSVPLRDGGIQLEKSFEERDIEIEIHPVGTITLLVFDKDANCLEEINYNIKILDSLISKLQSLA